MEGGKQMEMDKAQFAEKLKALLELGKKKKNVLEYQEINDFFQGITLTTEQMDLNIWRQMVSMFCGSPRMMPCWNPMIFLWKRKK